MENQEKLLKDKKKSEVVYVIYKITNLINGKYYIGFHKTYDGYEETDGYMGSGNLIKAAVKKYGKKNFKKEILFKTKNRAEAIIMEKKCVVVRNEENEDSYNLVRGGELSLEEIEHTYTSTEEFKEIISKRFKGVPKSEEQKEKIRSSHRGKKHSWQNKINKNPEKIEKMRQKHLGMKRSKSACENIKNAINESIKKKKEEGTYKNGLKDKKIYHNIITDKEQYFSNEEYENLVNKNEWEYGWSENHKNKIDRKQRGNNNRGKVFINKDGEIKRVKKEELKKLLNDGWKIGKGYRVVYINNGKVVKEIKECDLNNWLNNGWIKGRKLSEYKND